MNQEPEYNFYFKKDDWSEYEVSHLFCGFNPDHRGVIYDPEHKVEKINQLIQSALRNKKIVSSCIVFRGYNGNTYGFNPKTIIDWGISKGIDLPEPIIKWHQQQNDSAEINSNTLKTAKNKYKERDNDFTSWLKENDIDLNSLTWDQIHEELINRNSQLWAIGFADWKKQQKFHKGNSGRPKKIE